LPFQFSLNEPELINELKAVFEVEKHSKNTVHLDIDQIKTWIMQFPQPSRKFILSESIYFFKHGFYSIERIEKALYKFLHFLIKNEGSGILNRLKAMSVNTMHNKAHIEFSAHLTNILKEHKPQLTPQSSDYPVYYYLNDIIYDGNVQFKHLKNFIENISLHKSAKLYIFSIYTYTKPFKQAFKEIQIEAQEKYLDISFVSNHTTDLRIGNHSSSKAEILFRKVENEYGPEKKTHYIEFMSYLGTHSLLPSIFYSDKNNWLPLFKK
jgi:hypothetical protein